MKQKYKFILFGTLFILACSVMGYKYVYPRATKLIRQHERCQNQKHSYDFPSQNNGWEKYGDTPVYGGGDSVMFDPYCYVEDSCLTMLVSDRNNKVLATVTSMDGVHWGNYKILLSGVEGTWEHVVNRGCIVKQDSIWFLWYTGQYQGGSNIGVATSKDGTNFYRNEYDNPVLKPEFEHEKVSVMNPCVLWDEDSNSFKMWYSAGETYEPDVICYAESTDGIRWNKRKDPVLQKGMNEYEKERVGGCCVLKTKYGFYMFYIGYQNIDVARICYAESSDGISWIRPDNNLLLSPSKGGWDSDAVYKPSVVIWDDKLHLYYNGRKGHGEYIGLALKTHSEISNEKE